MCSESVGLLSRMECSLTIGTERLDQNTSEHWIEMVCVSIILAFKSVKVNDPYKHLHDCASIQ